MDFTIAESISTVIQNCDQYTSVEVGGILASLVIPYMAVSFAYNYFIIAPVSNMLDSDRNVNIYVR